MADRLVPAIRLFYCYSDADTSLYEELDKHLVPLQNSGQLECWHHQMISPGGKRQVEIENQLNAAQIILLLVSPDFLASYSCYEKEMKLALQQHERGFARVIPIILRYAYWKDAPFSTLQALPANERPLAAWSNQDEFFANIADGIRTVIDEIADKQAPHGNNAHNGYQNTAKTRPSSRPDQNPLSGKYNNHANEIRVLVQGPNYGIVNNHGSDFSELIKLKELLRDDSTS